MQNEFLKYIRSFSIRERVAFSLGIAQKVSLCLKEHAEIYASVCKALNVAWDWEESLLTTGNMIDEHVTLVHVPLWLKDDSGQVFEVLTNQQQVKAITAIVAILLYVAWHAYGQSGEICVTDPVNESGEDNIDDALSCAIGSGQITQLFLSELHSAIVTSSSCNDPVPRYYATHVLGHRINRSIVFDVINK